jgi:nucleotide-binding universal stress UspA family protein
MAEENQARLLLLHVLPDPSADKIDAPARNSVADIMHRLSEIVPLGAELWCRPEATVGFGNPADRILEIGKQLDADLIVLGVRDPGKRMGAATHLERTTAHQVVAHSTCPVLTIRG